jgi:hypothetical protein
MITDKIRPHHLERKALLYVRQSSAHQVLHNRESSALQYAMRDRLITLGWSETTISGCEAVFAAVGGAERHAPRTTKATQAPNAAASQARSGLM